MNNAPDKHRKALGKGLSALLPSRPQPATAAPDDRPDSSEVIYHVPVGQVDPNPHQPRSHFKADRLDELADSIRATGVLQPLIVRRSGDRFELIAGERRLRAARLAGLSDVPVLIQDLSNERMLEVALIENLQREDLNPIESARAFDRLHREFGLTQEEIGRRTGKDRTSIANTLRLLRLPKEIQLLIEDGRLWMGQARAILGLQSPEVQIQVAEKAAAQGLSTRQVERLVKQLSGDGQDRASKKNVSLDPNVRAAVEELQRVLGTRVRIVQQGEQRGRIEIDYYSTEDLDRIYRTIASDEAD